MWEIWTFRYFGRKGGLVLDPVEDRRGGEMGVARFYLIDDHRMTVEIAA